MLGATGDEARDGAMEIGLVEQEGVVPLVAHDLDEADVCGAADEGVAGCFSSRAAPVARS